MSESVAAVLRQARQRYASCPSHAPYGESPDSGSYCVISACCAISYTEDTVDALKEAAGVAGRTGDGFWTNEHLIRWNADASTDEVLAAFDRAIAKAQEAAA